MSRKFVSSVPQEQLEGRILELMHEVKELRRTGVFAETLQDDGLEDRVTGKTLVQLIRELLVLHAQYGNCKVELLGCYASTGDIEKVEYVPAGDKDWHNQHPLVVFESDICSG